MTNYAFEIRKWPKRHEYVIEECTALHVGEILGHLPFYNDQNLIPWSPPNNLRLRVVPGRGGIFVKWWFQCQGCGRKCENLYVPPDWNLGDWRCRTCHSLIYASQRYGHRHPLRKVMTHRKEVGLRKEIMRGRPRKKSWENPTLLVQAKEIRTKLDGIAGKAFSKILEIAESCPERKLQDRAKRLLKRYVSKL